METITFGLHRRAGKVEDMQLRMRPGAKRNRPRTGASRSGRARLVAGAAAITLPAAIALATGTVGAAHAEDVIELKTGVVPALRQGGLAYCWSPECTGPGVLRHWMTGELELYAPRDLEVSLLCRSATGGGEYHFTLRDPAWTGLYRAPVDRFKTLSSAAVPPGRIDDSGVPDCDQALDHSPAGGLPAAGP